MLRNDKVPTLINVSYFLSCSGSNISSVFSISMLKRTKRIHTIAILDARAFVLIGFWDAGKSRPLASFTPKGKLKGKFGKIPTFAELGHGDDMVYYMQRSIVAPPKISVDAQKYYETVFEKVYKTDEWQSYMKKKGLERVGNQRFLNTFRRSLEDL